MRRDRIGEIRIRQIRKSYGWQLTARSCQTTRTACAIDGQGRWLAFPCPLRTTNSCLPKPFVAQGKRDRDKRSCHQLSDSICALSQATCSDQSVLPCPSLLRYETSQQPRLKRSQDGMERTDRPSHLLIFAPMPVMSGKREISLGARTQTSSPWPSSPAARMDVAVGRWTAARDEGTLATASPGVK